MGRKDNNMTKKDIATKIAEEHSLTAKQAAAVVDTIIDTIETAVADGDKVTIPGFGTFEVRERAARTGRNPSTGETIEVSASKAPAFKAGRTFKNRVNG